jgi:hypothetical protein
MLACLVILRFDLAWTYLEGWWFNLRHLNRTLASRRIVQSSRKVSDKMVSLHFYRGSAKLRAALGKARHRLKAWQRHRKMSKKSLV